ncbi:GNAT family N-acetyltransferase [Belnapia moabensis]|uniref:GNAT family N-acetyltransferase n=1 Tax=Belnapia moabensis TaxID=365533 RepID=UPI0005BB14DD|nr:GNAT family N-acetyltransferase [Belnapia moabensis]
MSPRILAVSDRPDLAPLVARWLVDAFHRPPADMTTEAMTALILAPPHGPEESFVLFEDDRPVGTASLSHDDLPSRPDLTPWLAGVFVLPEHRGRGHASALVRHVEGFARAASVAELWLYTRTAESLYARLGWQRVGLEQSNGHEVALMRRRLDP